MRFLAKKKNSKNGFFFPTPLQQQLSSVAFRFEGASFFWFVFLFLFVNFLRFFLPTEAASGNEPRNERKIKQ